MVSETIDFNDLHHRPVQLLAQGKSFTLDYSVRILSSSTPKESLAICSSVVRITTLRDLHHSCVFLTCDVNISHISVIYSTSSSFGVEFTSFFLPYSDRWRLRSCCHPFSHLTHSRSTDRRIFHQAFRLEAAPSFRPIQMRNAHTMVLNLLHSPLEYRTHLHSCVLLLSKFCRSVAL